MLEADRRLSREVPDANFEAAIGRTSALHVLWLLVDPKRIAELAPGWIKDAETRGDRFSLVELNIFAGVADTAAGRFDRARARIVAALDRWPIDEFSYQHWVASKALAHIDLLTARVQEAWPRLQDDIRRAKKAGLFDTLSVRVDLWFLRGRLALTRAADEPEIADAMLKVVRADARRLGKEAVRSSRGQGELLQAGIHLLRNEHESAQAHLREAREHFVASQMELHAAAVDAKLADLSADPMARAAADDFARGRGVSDPEGYWQLF